MTMARFRSSLPAKIAICVLAVLLAVSALLLKGNDKGTAVFMPTAFAAELELRPSQHDAMGIDNETEFILSSKNPLTIDEIREKLVITPDLPYEIKPADKKDSFRIIPAAPLQAASIYKFRMNGLSWAFQARSEFKVLRTLPADKTSGVPVNTGIEIVFNHEGYMDPAPYFQITPHVDGHFERFRKTAVFIPKKLEPGTIYTVSLKKELGVQGSSEKLGKDIEFQFETEAQASQSYSYLFHMGKNLYEFPSGENPLLEIYYHGGNQSADLSVDLYRYQGIEEFRQNIISYYATPNWAWSAKAKYRENVSGLEKKASFTTPVQQSGYRQYIHFPEALPKGFYLAEISLGQQSWQVRIQVTDISAYVAAGTDNILVWANDMASASPVKGAGVMLDGESITGATGNDGIIVFKTPESFINSQNQTPLLTVQSPQGDVCILPVSLGSYDYYFQNPTYNYWKYLFLDRDLFLPNDTVHFWGLINPRDGAARGDKVTAYLTMWGYYDAGNNPLRITADEFPLSDMGTFTGSLKLPDVTPGYYELAVEMNGKVIISKWLRVETYTKPAYKLEIKEEKKAVFSGREPYNFKIKASFFEGTPVTSMELSYNFDNSGTVKTDTQGEAVVSGTYPYSGSSAWGPYSHATLHVNNTLPEAGEIYSSTSVLIFHNDLNISTETRTEGDEAEIKVQANWITLDKINRDGFKEHTDYLGKPAANRQLSGKLYENYYEKGPEKRYYDFINKEVRTWYEYIPKERYIMDFQIETDQEGKGSFRFPCKENQTFTAVLTTKDGMDRGVERRVTLHTGKEFQWWVQNNFYHLKPDRENSRYALDETYTVTLKNNHQDIELEDKHRVLYLNVRNGIRSYQVAKNSYQAKFTEKDIPNLYVSGILFNGRKYYETGYTNIYFDHDTRKLDIGVTADKPSYKPGEEVTLDITTRDSSGRPKPAEVNISLVDEALFALHNQYVNTLASIYGNHASTGILTSAYSHWHPEFIEGGGAEMGDGGGQERINFVDTAFFTSVRTDAKGFAQVKFKLPDNLTSWRATYQGFTTDIRAGNGSIPITVKLPFFVDMVMNDTYLKGDAPVVTLRTFGSALSGGEDIKFTVKAPGLLPEPREYQGKAFSTVRVPLPELDEGTYKVTVEASGKGHKDILTKSFTAHSSYLKREKSVYYQAAPGLTVEGAKKGITTVIFTDLDRGRLLPALYNLFGSYGKRLEQRLARRVAGDMLNSSFGMNYELEEDLNTAAYQTAFGGIAILPYASGQADLSALVAALAPEYYDITSLKSYFYKLLSDKLTPPEDICAALWGLASLGEPVLTEIKYLAGLGAPDPKSGLYLALALFELGDLQAAHDLNYRILKEYGEDMKPLLRINYGINNDDTLENTSLAAVLGAKLNLPEGDRLFDYIKHNTAKTFVTYLEELLYIREKLTTLSTSPASLTYSLAGQTHSIDLSKNPAHHVYLTPDTLPSFSVREVKGNIGLTSLFREPYQSSETEDSADLGITRTYYANSAATTDFTSTDLVKIVINFNLSAKAVEGVYQIVDYLPSGLKPVAAPYVRDRYYVSYPYEIEGQRISFYVYDNSTEKKIVYYARVVSPGTYRAHGAVIQHMLAKTIMKSTPDQTITIK